MKEHPILFSGPMVRAILDGRKTQTRRVVKHQASVVVHPNGQPMIDGFLPELRCPYGGAGDRLWVKETWAAWDSIDDREASEVEGTARDLAEMGISQAHCSYRADPLMAASRWRPSVFMPRWASRITLGIVSLKVERLQDITEEDAKAEGVECPERGTQCSGFRPPGNTSLDPEECVCIDGYAPLYHALWDSINGKTRPWDSNPWVWVVEFKRNES